MAQIEQPILPGENSAPRALGGIALIRDYLDR